MSSFATVTLSLFSPAISSSTGATILHGPHQVAQKSTTTGLSLLRTALSNVASVTSTVLAMCTPFLELPVARCLVRSGGDGGDLLGRGAVATADQLAGHRCVGEPALGVDGRGASGAGRGDGLPVDVVDEVACGEHAGDRGAGARRLDLQVAVLVGGEHVLH